MDEVRMKTGENEAIGVTESDMKDIARAERKARNAYIVTGGVTAILSFILGKLSYDAIGRPLDPTYPYAVALVSSPTLTSRKIIPWLTISVIAFVAFIAGGMTEADMESMEGTLYGVSAVGNEHSPAFGRPVEGHGPTCRI